MDLQFRYEKNTDPNYHYHFREYNVITFVFKCSKLIYENTFDGVKCLLVVLEYCEGGDLLTRFEKQGSEPYSEEKVARIIRQIGSAVMYLHDINIAHRDIKLENILCTIDL